MTEKDTARAIVKNLCHRDMVTGDIIYLEKNLPAIHNALIGGKYCVFIEKPIPSKHISNKPEKDWRDLSVDVVEQVLSEVTQGEVLNRPASPCWWR